MLIGSDKAEALNRILFRNMSDSRTVLNIIGQSLHVPYDLILGETLPDNLIALASRIRLRAASRHRKARSGAKRLSPPRQHRSSRARKGRLAG
jgi:hypothetical protein